MFSERNRDISGFRLAADGHFYLCPFQFRILPRLLLTQSAFAKTTSTAFWIQTTTTNHYNAVWCSKCPFKHLQTPLVTTHENGNTVLKSITALTVFSCLLSSFHSLATFLMLSSSHFCIKKENILSDFIQQCEYWVAYVLTAVWVLNDLRTVTGLALSAVWFFIFLTRKTWYPDSFGGGCWQLENAKTNSSHSLVILVTLYGTQLHYILIQKIHFG